MTEYALEGSVFIGGAVVQWLRDGLGIIRRSGDVEALARSVPDNGDVYLVPAFAGLGAPHWDQHARGVIVGLTRGATAGHIARAALESIAFQSGGSARRDAGRCRRGRSRSCASTAAPRANNLLMQFQADLLGAPVVRPRITETTALGAAYFAGLAVGFWKDLDAISHQWQVDRRFEPSMPESRVRELARAMDRGVGTRKSLEDNLSAIGSSSVLSAQQREGSRTSSRARSALPGRRGAPGATDVVVDSVDDRGLEVDGGVARPRAFHRGKELGRCARVTAKCMIGVARGLWPIGQEVQQRLVRINPERLIGAVRACSARVMSSRSRASHSGRAPPPRGSASARYFSGAGAKSFSAGYPPRAPARPPRARDPRRPLPAAPARRAAAGALDEPREQHQGRGQGEGEMRLVGSREGRDEQQHAEERRARAR